jgi:hypothetical protein
MGITSGQGPPSPQNGSRLSLGPRGVNTKLSASESFPQQANEFHKRTEQYENRDQHQGNLNEAVRRCYPRGERRRQTRR